MKWGIPRICLQCCAFTTLRGFCLHLATFKFGSITRAKQPILSTKLCTKVYQDPKIYQVLRNVTNSITNWAVHAMHVWQRSNPFDRDTPNYQQHGDGTIINAGKIATHANCTLTGNTKPNWLCTLFTTMMNPPVFPGPCSCSDCPKSCSGPPPTPPAPRTPWTISNVDGYYVVMSIAFGAFLIAFGKWCSYDQSEWLG